MSLQLFKRMILKTAVEPLKIPFAPTAAFRMMLLLLSCHSGYAEEPVVPPRPKLTLENSKKATEVVRNPAVITEKTGQGNVNVAVPTVKNATPPPAGSVTKGELKEDPTQMNQNFREALKRISQNKTGALDTGAAAGIAPGAPVLPKIARLASVFGGHKNKNSALLRINDKTEMVYAGDKITSLESNPIVEIQILDIHKHYVKIRVLPANKTIILR